MDSEEKQKQENLETIRQIMTAKMTYQPSPLPKTADPVPEITYVNDTPVVSSSTEKSPSSSLPKSEISPISASSFQPSTSPKADPSPLARSQNSSLIVETDKGPKKMRMNLMGNYR